MNIQVLKSKIHFAKITESNLYYEGSIGIDIDLLKKSNLHFYEKVLVTNVNNGLRWETYIIPEKENSKKITLNGTGARYGEVGDPIIIMSFTYIKDEELTSFRPTIIQLDDNNNVVK